MILISLAAATTGFDPTAPDATFTDTETYSLDGEYKLWSVIERLHDPDTTLFSAAEYNTSTEWPTDADYAPHIADCFGTQRPATSDALLHMGPSMAIASGTPILFVPGAADNASRGFVTMAWHQDGLLRPVFALTFAHPHGDVFEQAELVADAIARIKDRTGAAQVDIVGHSKGGSAVAVYLANSATAVWSDEAYMDVGTEYRGDVRRAVFIATPLGGIDTGFRWPLSNFYSLDAESAFSPSSWQTYYSMGVVVPASAIDLQAQDFFPEDGDLFPGQRQLLARQEDYALPGSLAWLGAYSLQPDWYTTYEGGYGFETYSNGIDAAIEAGGSLVSEIAQNGADPTVEIFTLAGNSALMPNGTEDWVAETYGDQWSEMNTGTDTWAKLLADLVGNGMMAAGYTEAEIEGLANGDLLLGEVSGESDGLVFVSSATDAAALTARGAQVLESKVVNLSHLDLLYASPITGELMIEYAAENPDMAWYASFGERYTEADTIGWVEDKLADDEEVVPDDTGDTGVVEDTGLSEDSGVPAKDSDGMGTNPKEEEETPVACGACNGVPGVTPWMGIFALALLRRRQRGSSSMESTVRS